MTINRNLFLSILAMDAYSRGYGVSISGLTETDGIGSATLITRSEIFKLR